MKVLNTSNLHGEKVSSMKMYSRSLKSIVRVILARIGWLIMQIQMVLKIKFRFLMTRIKAIKKVNVSNKNQLTNGLLFKVMMMMIYLSKAYLSTNQNIHQYNLSRGKVRTRFTQTSPRRPSSRIKTTALTRLRSYNQCLI